MAAPAAPDDVGGTSYDAVLADMQARGYGTEDADLRSYAQAGGSAGGAAACVALGAAPAAPRCAQLGAKIAGAIYDGVRALTHSGPTQGDLQAADLRQANELAIRANGAAGTALAASYAAVRQLAAALGQQASDPQISGWLSTVATRLNLSHVWPESQQSQPGPGGVGRSLVLVPFRVPPIGYSTFGQANPTAAQALPAIQQQLDAIVSDLRTATTAVLALLSTGAIRVTGDKVAFPAALARATYQPIAKAQPEAQPRESIDRNRAWLLVPGLLGAGAGAGLGVLLVPRRRRLVGACVGAVAGSVVGLLAGAALRPQAGP